MSGEVFDMAAVPFCGGALRCGVQWVRKDDTLRHVCDEAPGHRWADHMCACGEVLLPGEPAQIVPSADDRMILTLPDPGRKTP